MGITKRMEGLPLSCRNYSVDYSDLSEQRLIASKRSSRLLKQSNGNNDKSSWVGNASR